MKEYRIKRIEKISDIAGKCGSDAFITDNSNIISYITGYYPDKNTYSVVIVLENGDIYLVLPRNSDFIEEVNIYEYETSAADYEKRSSAVKRALKNIILNEDIVVSCPIDISSGFLVDSIYTECKSIIDAGGLLEEVLSIKDEAEIDNIKDTLKLNTCVYDVLRKYLKEGQTELDIYNKISSSFNELSGRPIDFLSDIISGVRASYVSGSAGSKKIKNGETVIVDILPNLNGYYSDTTRTYFIGKPSDENVKIYSTLINVMDSIKQYLHPGIYSDEIYNAVNKIIRDSGYLGRFPHHAGHGIGMKSFESPFFLKNYRQMLKPNMVVTIEPGIYIPGDVGMRIENNYIIRPEGCECIFNYSMDICDFII
ncbi:MAG: Xaa-Pro peptidase family protein [Clostridiales bacterium]|nr:Xaa-Pro peptidase family protein [Clostridiales bacterium]